jgi:hypothetical protein
VRVSHSFQAKRTSQSSIPPLLFWRTGSGSPNSIDEGRRNFPQSCPSAAVVLTGPDQVLIRKVYYPGRAWSATLKAGFGVLTGRNPADQTKIPCLSRVLGVWAHLESRCPMESKGAVFPPPLKLCPAVCFIISCSILHTGESLQPSQRLRVAKLALSLPGGRGLAHAAPQSVRCLYLFYRGVVCLEKFPVCVRFLLACLCSILSNRDL